MPVGDVSDPRCSRCGDAPTDRNPLGSLAMYRGRMEWFRALDLPGVWIAERGVCGSCGSETMRAARRAT